MANAYFYEYFRQLYEVPWSLARGDVLENLKAFAAQLAPTSGQAGIAIHGLMTLLGGPDGEMCSGVALLRDISFSTDVVEWAHKPPTQVVRRHKTLRGRTLALTLAAGRVGDVVPQA